MIKEKLKDLMDTIDKLVFIWISPFLMVLEVIGLFKGRRL